jgi:hypothetical protein
MKQDILSEILDELEPEWKANGHEAADVRLSQLRNSLKKARVMNLTEFTRATLGCRRGSKADSSK